QLPVASCQRSHAPITGCWLLVTGTGNWELQAATKRQELRELEQVEPRMAHDRRDDRASPQVDDAPERAEQPGGHRRIGALNEMTDAERGARHDNADGAAAKPPLESPQEKRPLNLF